MTKGGSDNVHFPHRHLLGIEGLSPGEISILLDRSETYVDQNRRADKTTPLLHGRTIINLFFEDSTRTRTSFELAGKRLGGDMINMSVDTSSVKKGETLIDTAMTLNAMRPDVLVVRHPHSGAVKLLSEKVNCAVINGGDGSHEHPTQALLDALTIRRRLGTLTGLQVAICGDILHSRVARSNIHLLNTMGARVRLIAPKTLIPPGIERLGVEVFHDMETGIKDCDIVMMLRLQRERMGGNFLPSIREYFHFFGLDYEKLANAKPDALTIRRRLGTLSGLLVAISGDILHSRVARSNIHLLNTMGARVRLIAPKTLIPPGIERMGVEVFHDMETGVKDCDIVMMLRLQRERMNGNFLPSIREYFHFFGLDYEKLSHAKKDALIMHPGPMNRGVEIDTEVADDVGRSVIREQVEMGVAVRMAVLELLAQNVEAGTGAGQ